MMSSASAKIILSGEHAVVYGEPAIAIPVSSLRAYAEVQESESFQIIARDLNDRVISFADENPLIEAVRQTLAVLKRDVPPISIAVRSDIPIASGLGSGAAISTAIIRSLLDYSGEKLSLEAVNDLVFEVEKIHHGTPSGIDNTVIVYEKPVYFVRGNPIEMIENKTPLKLIVGDTGTVAPTRESVGDVRRLYEENPAKIKPVIEDIGKLSRQARQAMQSGELDRIGQLMLDNHRLLQELTVSSEQLDRLVDSAVSAGAYGAKLSGGGRGGNMIALVNDESAPGVVSALRDAGAVRVFETTLETS